MEQTDLYYVAKYWNGSFHSLVSGPWLDSLIAEDIKKALRNNSNKESYEVVRQRIEVCIY